jgi:sarcosine oxidase subunit gamma
MRRTALAPHADALASVGAREIAIEAQISVRTDAAVGAGLGLPTDPNTWVSLGDGEALWLGPDEWLVTSGGRAAADVVPDLDDRLARDHRSVVDVSAGRVVIELAGADRFDLLFAGCGLDLDTRSWRAGMCAQTLLANVAVLLQEREDSTRIYVRPSFAAHLASWFTTVAAQSRPGSS